jgi:exodeoxyribonuclease V alpha subunit
LPTEDLIPLAEKLLEVPQQLIGTALDLEVQDGTVVADRVGETPCIFLAALHRAERIIAERLMRLANGRLPWHRIGPIEALLWVEERIGLARRESGCGNPARIHVQGLGLYRRSRCGKNHDHQCRFAGLGAKSVNLLLCARPAVPPSA